MDEPDPALSAEDMLAVFEFLRELGWAEPKTQNPAFCKYTREGESSLRKLRSALLGLDLKPATERMFKLTLFTRIGTLMSPDGLFP